MATATANVLFVWKPEYEVGIREVDDQHKKLVELINKLQEAMITGAGRQVLGGILDELGRYTRLHFASEERLLRAHQYPDYSAHQALHRTLERTVEEYVRDFQSGKIAMTVRVMHFLKDWLSNHILNTDKKYVPHLMSRGVR